MKQWNSLVRLLAAVLSIGFAISCHAHAFAASDAPAQQKSSDIPDIRQIMLDSSRALDKNFPDGKELVLANFAYLGTVTTPQGLIHVVSWDAFIPNMLAPRGVSGISLYTADGRWIDNWHVDAYTPPLWCEGSRIYFSNVTLWSGNVLDLADGVNKGHWLNDPKYFLPSKPAAEEPPADAKSFREKMIASAENCNGNFPDGNNQVLTRFTSIGTVKTRKGLLHVIDCRAVTPYDRVPGKMSWLSFHDVNGAWIADLSYDPAAPPIRCEGSRVYFSGFQGTAGDGGDVLDLADGLVRRRWIDEGKNAPAAAKDPATPDIRQIMLESARKQDKRFPDGHQSILTRFAYIGTITTGQKQLIRVVDCSSVCPDMLSPREQAWISFHAADGTWIGSQMYDLTKPFSCCKGSRIYFCGLQGEKKAKGNALDLSNSLDSRRWVIDHEEGTWMPQK